MNRGTASERVARWLSGEHQPGDARHVAQCEKCGEELARMELALSSYRGAVRQWSARQPGAERPDSISFARARHAYSVRRMRWAVVAAAMVVMAAIPSWKALRDRQRDAEADRADADLLEQVSYQLSQPAPGPLEPIQRLFVAGAGGAAQDSADAEATLKGEKIQ